jgi:hypothetical protein
MSSSSSNFILSSSDHHITFSLTNTLLEEITQLQNQIKQLNQIKESIEDEHALVIVQLNEQIAKLKVENTLLKQNNNDNQPNNTTTTDYNNPTLRAYLAGISPSLLKTTSEETLELLETVHEPKTGESFNPLGVFCTLKTNALCMSLFKHGIFCIVGSGDKIIRVFDTVLGTLLFSTDVRPAPPIQIATSSPTNHIVVGRLDGGIDVFIAKITPAPNLGIQLQVSYSYSHQVSKSILSLCCSIVDDDFDGEKQHNDQVIFASTARDSKVIFWNPITTTITTTTTTTTTANHEKKIFDLKENAETSTFVDVQVLSNRDEVQRWFVVALSNELVIFDSSLNTVNMIEIFSNNSGLITSICEVRTVPSMIFITNSLAGTICLFDIIHKMKIKEFIYPKSNDEFSRACLKCDPNGQGWIAFTDGSPFIMVWHISNNEHSFPFKIEDSHTASVRSLVWDCSLSNSNTITTLWSCGFDKVVKKWNVME